ncbi:hypothetical protein AVL61_10670 [Kocuria rosea subsp. polaris]|uniref:Lipoprotein n=1 Tax=Kocuria rosea subsp. polaris TaxID=136273 RepID=A0A0W8I0X3_KOCRO|nr:hypothetical protein [Kocuria polaris]KUG51262.1 hypothetical protein AVL61_10670 [Kocuria polaris]
MSTSSKKKMFALPAAAAVASALMVGCAEETPVQEAEEAGPTAEAAILDETVTMQNEVTEIVGPNLFTVGEDDTPVVGVDAAAQDIQDGDMVQVTGTVRQIVQTDVESEWDWDFDNDEMDYLVERELDLAVIADEVRELPAK